MIRMWLWTLAVIGAVSGVWSYLLARRNARKLEHLTQSYWELRYQHGQLRAQVNRIDPEHQADAEAEMAGRPAQNFIPLSSLKR